MARAKLKEDQATVQVMIRLPADEAAQLRKLAGRGSLAAKARELLREALSEQGHKSGGNRRIVVQEAPRPRTKRTQARKEGKKPPTDCRCHGAGRCFACRREGFAP
jgi:hypothetical protein